MHVLFIYMPPKPTTYLYPFRNLVNGSKKREVVYFGIT